MGSEEAEERVLRHVDVPRRAFLRKLILGSAFAAPAVASFSMSGLGVEKVQASSSNQFAYPGIPGQENCYGQTIAYLEHPLTQAVPAECLIQVFSYYLENVLHIEPGHGVGSLANQWCKYGTNFAPP